VKACQQAFTRRRGPVRSLHAAPVLEERTRLVAALAAAGNAVAR
jgi:hypothetical protein